MNDKKNTPPDYALDLDVAGPAAWDDEMESFGRATKKPDLKSAGGGDKNKTAARTRIRRSAAPKSGGGLRGLIAGLFWLAASLGLAGLVAAFGLYAYFSQDLPSTAWLKNHELPTITYIYSDDGRVVGEYSHERRIIKSLNEIPPMVVNAFLAVEDAKFYQHHGVNFKAIIRAAYVNFTQGDLSQGASTITQQVVRGLILTPEKTVSRKIREAILAFRIEGNLSKEEIIGLYLNLIYLGRGAYGVEAAARTYFDKGVEHLTVAEAALLAGIAHSPEGKNPLTKPQEARERQRHSIGRMKELGYITTEEAEAALNEVLSINGSWPNPNTTVAPYFTEHVRRILEEKYGADSLYNDGWKIYATVNIEAQKAADAAVARGLWEYARRRGFKGPVTHMELEEQIAAFISEEEKKLPAGGLKPDRLYQAVVMEVDDKNAALAVRVGPYHGHIAKNNLSWALKGSIKGRFSRGDVVWVRLLEEAAPKKDEAAEAGGDSRDLSAVLAQNAGLAERLEMSLEQRTDLQAALLSMDALNGDVKAMVGGRDFSESQFNRATQSQRQPGSSFKPIVYAAAMDNGFTPGSVMLDAPLVIDDRGSGRRWKPVNSDLKFRGPMSLYSALISSRNLISIKILDRIGFEALDETAAAMGIKEKLPHSLTVALGAHGLHMPELLTAYSTFPNLGERVEPRYIVRIEDRHGKVVETFEPARAQAFSSGTACAVGSMLQGVISQGTGTVVKPLKRPVAGKTGTTNDYSDAWFIGYTPELVTAVWMGTDQQRERAVGEVGGRAAGPIFLYYMQEALKDAPITEFAVPPDAQMVGGVCYKAGTVGSGISETITETSGEESFLRDDFAESLDEDEALGEGLDEN